MKTKDRHEAFGRIARRSALLVALLLMLLPAARISRAQSNAKPALVGAKGPTGAIPKAPAPPAAKSSSHGPSDGIKVHGYWTIEVRNPDGKVAKHLEFENQLCTAFVDPGTGAFVPGGDTTLAFLFTGQAAPGAWSIVLGNPEAGSAPNCDTTAQFYLSQSGVQWPSSFLNAYNVAPFEGTSAPPAAIALTCSLPGQQPPCFPTVAAVSTGPNYPEVADYYLYWAQGTPPGPAFPAVGPAAVNLGGQFIVPSTVTSPITISAVGTDFFTCFGNPSPPTPADCLNFARETAGAGNYLSGEPCTVFPSDQKTGPPAPEYLETSGCIESPALSSVTIPTSYVAYQQGRSPFSGVVLTGTGGIPSPFTVSAGQTVSVTWTFSFSSN
jgi:hypothetical protein